MDEKIITIYCLCDDWLKALSHHEDPQCRVIDAEIMTCALVSMRYFQGNFERGRDVLRWSRYMPDLLSRSRFNRRLHALKERFAQLFIFLGQLWKHLNEEATYVLDSFPIPVCDNIRIGRCRLYRDEAFRGFCPSKKRYFYGLKLHLMITGQGQPIELFLSPGQTADVNALQWYSFDLDAGSIVYGDKAYTDYGIEDLLAEALDVTLSPLRKKNSKRPVPPHVAFVQHYQRKTIETVGSQLEQLFPHHIHAVTPQGFELKVFLFVLAYSVCAL